VRQAPRGHDTGPHLATDGPRPLRTDQTAPATRKPHPHDGRAIGNKGHVAAPREVQQGECTFASAADRLYP